MSNEESYRYFRRDISWLSFNFRVLMEAGDTSLPLYERINFIAIYTSNLEEFYKIRVAEHKAAVSSSRQTDENADDAARLIDDITREVNRQMEFRIRVFERQIVPELERNRIILHLSPDVKPAHKDFINDFFKVEVFPYLSPVPLDRDNINVFLRDNEQYVCLRMRRRLVSGNIDAEATYFMVKVPSAHLPRFVELPELNGCKHIMFIEDVIKACAGKMFPGFIVECGYSFKISRDADILVDDIPEGHVLEQLKQHLRKRKIGAVSRFVYDRLMPGEMLSHLIYTFGVHPDELVPGDKHLNLEDLSRLPNPSLPPAGIEKPKPMVLESLSGDGAVTKAVRQCDMMLFYPYHSFGHFIAYLNELACDPEIDRIMLTQYRVAEDSEVVDALVRAARNGKKVTVFVEFKARFDEANNMATAERMSKAGVEIVQSLPKLKVHAKVALALRRSGHEGRGDLGYAYVGTGNFNEKTARVYADCGLFTADKTICADLRSLFEALVGKRKECVFGKLLVARFNMIDTLTSLINREMRLAREGRSGRIVLKMNAIQDKAMIDKLYEASQAGVQIDLIVRGICCLVPGESFSRNIRVTRIVDSFLEHARIWCFGNGGTPIIYMGSPDWMKRNLYKRIEVVAPIEDESIKKDILRMLDLQLADNTKACFIGPHLENLRKADMAFPEGAKRVRCQYDFYEYLREKQKR